MKNRISLAFLSGLAAFLITALLTTGAITWVVYSYENEEKTEVSVVHEDEKSYAEPVAIDEEYLLSVLASIDEVSWSKKSADNKIQILQLIADYEAINVLGIPSTKVFYDVLNDDFAGVYSQASYRYDSSITIDKNFLYEGSCRVVIGCLLHEIRHHYQITLINVMNDAAKVDASHKNINIFRDAAIYEENKKEYKKFDADGEIAYLSQPLEVDARAYSLLRMAEFYTKALP